MLVVDKARKAASRKTFFKSKTFTSKLFLRLTKDQINPVIACVQILKFESANRTKKDIAKTLPWLISLQPFNSFITYKEDNNNYENTFIQFATVLYYQYIKQNRLFKQVGDKTNYFYLIMAGTVEELYLVFNKETLTDEEYYVHLIKLQLLNENEIVKRIMYLNSETINFHQETVEQYINNHTKLNYKQLLKKAKEMLLMLNIHVSSYVGSTIELQTYMKAIALVVNDNTQTNNLKLIVKSNKDKKTFLIPFFIHNKTLNNGSFIGELSPYNNLTKKHIDNVAYYASEQTDMGYINKIEYSNETIFKILKQRMQDIFNQEQTSYYILQNINPSTFASLYSPLITYKQLTKGDKLFIQHSFYNGVYLISSGEFEVSSTRAYDELDNLMILLQASLDNYNEYISPLHQGKLPLDNLNELMHNPVFQSNEFLVQSKEKRKIILTRINNNKEVIGLNEYYNSKNNLYHFTVECLSEIGFYYFINKDVFTYMLNREHKLKESVKQMVQLKANYFIGTIDKYKKQFIRSVNGSIHFNKKENIFKKSFQINKMLISGFTPKSSKRVLDKQVFVKMFANNNDDTMKMKFNGFTKDDGNNDNERVLSLASHMRSTANTHLSCFGSYRKQRKTEKNQTITTTLIKGRSKLKLESDNDDNNNNTNKHRYTYNTINIKRNMSNNKIITHHTNTLLPPIYKQITRSFSNISKLKPMYVSH